MTKNRYSNINIGVSGSVCAESANSRTKSLRSLCSLCEFNFLCILCILCEAICVGCTSDMLLDDSGYRDDNQVTFTMNIGNTTRSTRARLEDSNHTSFGVFSHKYNSSDDKQTVMPDYLVQYANSQWGYDGLKTTSGAAEDQYYKFWDKNYKNYYFAAYAPYKTTVTPSYFALAEGLQGVVSGLTISGVSSFYTSPVTNDGNDGNINRQVSSATAGATDAALINANEALYAYTKVDKADYGKDVPLYFKHINAQIKLKFYAEVDAADGRRMELTDMVPTKITKGTGDSPDPYYDIAKQVGIVLTPANYANQSSVEQPKKANRKDANNTTYITKEDIAFSIAETKLSTQNAAGTLVGKGTPTKLATNLYFQLPTNTTLSKSKSEAAESPTVYYALPSKGSDCGYTAHVSFKIKPEGSGDAATQVYDARVWIPAEDCQWEAGKCYTYIFKIPVNSNGKTGVNDAESQTISDYPYIDPDDPRVTSETGKPIVFDGVTITDYEDPEVWPDSEEKYYVDLGLPSGTLWSIRNFGAETETDFGKYYKWGSLVEFDPDDPTKDMNTEYKDYYNVVPKNPAYDIVNYTYGGNLMIPTKVQWQELLDNTTQTWKSNYNETGVSGILFTATNGNSIFLPAASYYEDDGDFWAEDPDDAACDYWSSSMCYESGMNQQQAFEFLGMGDDSYIECDFYKLARFYAMPIRPVLYTDVVKLYQYGYVDLGIRGDGKGTHIQDATVIDNSLDKILFARQNLGAESETDYGDRYVWGVTEKYPDCTIPNSEKISSISQNLAYDAAGANWYEPWQLPTKEIWQFIVDNKDTKFTITEEKNYKGSGTNGVLIVSKIEGYEGNSIFLPYAGKNESESAGTIGCYWTGNPNTTTEAYSLDIGGTDIVTYSSSTLKTIGASIRPVILATNTDE